MTPSRPPLRARRIGRAADEEPDAGRLPPVLRSEVAGSGEPGTENGSVPGGRRAPAGDHGSAGDHGPACDQVRAGDQGPVGWPAIAAGAAIVAVAISIPPVYESSGTILVESQQISPDLIAANNNSYADERIEVIRQRVMTRENLLRIIDKYNLYAGSGRQLSESDKIDQMRNSITVTTLSTSVKGRGEVTVAFQVAFDDRRPDLAKDVANELVTLFLDENIKQCTERASETTEFLSQGANKLGAELASLENQLADFKQAHANALPEHQELRMSMLSRSELEFREVDRDYKAAQEELRYLEMVRDRLDIDRLTTAAIEASARARYRLAH